MGDPRDGFELALSTGPENEDDEPYPYNALAYGGGLWVAYNLSVSTDGPFGPWSEPRALPMPTYDPDTETVYHGPFSGGIALGWPGPSFYAATFQDGYWWTVARVEPLNKTAYWYESVKRYLYYSSDLETWNQVSFSGGPDEDFYYRYIEFAAYDADAEKWYAVLSILGKQYALSENGQFDINDPFLSKNWVVASSTTLGGTWSVGTTPLVKFLPDYPDPSEGGYKAYDYPNILRMGLNSGRAFIYTQIYGDFGTSTYQSQGNTYALNSTGFAYEWSLSQGGATSASWQTTVLNRYATTFEPVLSQEFLRTFSFLPAESVPWGIPISGYGDSKWVVLYGPENLHWTSNPNMNGGWNEVVFDNPIRRVVYGDGIWLVYTDIVGGSGQDAKFYAGTSLDQLEQVEVEDLPPSVNGGFFPNGFVSNIYLGGDTWMLYAYEVSEDDPDYWRDYMFVPPEGGGWGIGT